MTTPSIIRNKYTLNRVELIQSGEPFFTCLIDLINQAQQVVHVQYYIFDLDVIGTRVLHALQQAAARGVKVLVVVDAYASAQITSQNAQLFTDYGILLKRFSPLKNKKGWGIGRRLHHKICWVDGKAALVGGINIADKYCGTPMLPAWLDFALLVKGPICIDIRKVCEEIWSRKLVKKLAKTKDTVLPNQASTFLSRITKNDWLRSRIEISSSYRYAFKHAQTDITIVASYFLPGNRMRRILKNAADRGVRVQIILVGDSDVPFVKPAMTYLYDWMLRHNMEIYEWQKSVLHGKLAVVDDRWVTVGSYNINALSDYGSLELNIETIDDTFAIQTKNVLNQLIHEGCIPVNQARFTQRKNWFKQFNLWLSYTLIRMALRLLFGLMQGRKPSHF